MELKQKTRSHENEDRDTISHLIGTLYRSGHITNI